MKYIIAKISDNVPLPVLNLQIPPKFIYVKMMSSFCLIGHFLENRLEDHQEERSIRGVELEAICTNVRYARIG